MNIDTIISRFAPLLMNFISPIIILLFIANIVVFSKTKRAITDLVDTYQPRADIRTDQQVDMNITDSRVEKLIKYSKSASKKYTLYTNITAVFPLLGILGTVTSLMNLSSTDDISANFAAALSTTFLGLIFAIGFKIIDSWISADLERALDDAEYLIHQHDEEKRMKYAP